ncbi:MAG TPA: hypothetical protein DCL54_12820 [Alphaproteobacteria bacterium]|nr:hypothetical protein [Alphaproteobacteria bacterium]HAJ47452.1 hypothetical protein [Alphaproteobacteria bacterium]
MAVIDLSAIAEFEIEARNGKPTALYQLGLAYSTGQGVPLDLITAHKYFNLAASRGVSEARDWRSELASQMSPTEVAEAQRLARAWIAQSHQ